MPLSSTQGTCIIGCRDSSDWRILVTRHPRVESAHYFVMDQWQVEELAKVRRKVRVKIVTDGLSSEVLARCFVEHAPSVEQALASSLAEYGPEATIAVIPKGPYVLQTLLG